MDSTFREDYYDELEAALYVGKTPRTLKSWRDQRIGPPVTYLGGKPFYRKEALKSWLRSLEGKPARKRRKRAASA